MQSDKWLEIRLQARGDVGSRVPLEGLSESLQAFLKLTYLVSSAYFKAGVPFADARVLRKQFFDFFDLSCEPMKSDSVAALVTLSPRNESTRSLDDSELEYLCEDFKTFFDKTINATSNANEDALFELIPNPPNVRRVIAGVESLIPNGEYALQLQRDSLSRPTLFDSERDQRKVRGLKWGLKTRENPTVTSTLQELTLIAEIMAIDFTEGLIDAETFCGLKIQTNFFANAETKGKLLDDLFFELDGTYLVADNGDILEFVEEKEKRFTDTSPIRIDELELRGERLRALPPLEFAVGFDPTDHSYTIEGDFDISLYAYSRSELESVLHEMLDLMWLDYAQEDNEEKLAPSAIRLKQEMLARLIRI